MHLPFDHRRQAGVREARDRHARVLPEVAEVLAHLGRARGAVDADDVGAHGVEGGQGGTDLGAREHGARELHRDLHLDRHLAARRGHRPAAADHPGLGAEQVELRLDEEQVDPALEETGRLLLVRIAELGEPDLTEGGELGARAHRAGDEPPVAVGHLAGDARRGEVDLVRSLRDPVLGERHGEGAEGGGLHDVDADLEELVVHRGDHVGAGDARAARCSPRSGRPRSRRDPGPGSARRCRRRRRRRRPSRGRDRGSGWHPWSGKATGAPSRPRSQ